MRSLFTPEQLAALDEMEKKCAEIDKHIEVLRSMGIDLDDREAINAQRRQMCQRCRDVQSEYTAAQK